MQSIAIADNYMILDFLMQRDEAGARHAMSIHIRHLLKDVYKRQAGGSGVSMTFFKSHQKLHIWLLADLVLSLIHIF